MAGSIEQGFESESKDEDNTTPFVYIDTPMFRAETIGMYQMPGLKVLDVVSEQGPKQLVKMVDLFMLSINEPERIEDFKLLNFVELGLVLDQWTKKSQEYGPSPDDDFMSL
jgi:hypothetical protein